MLGPDTHAADSYTAPHADIRRRLVARRCELLTEIHRRVRRVREEGGTSHHHAAQLVETVDTDPEDDLPFALIQLKTETLARVDEAVRQLDEGTYGHCLDCNDQIAPVRLRAMPFAVRCRGCQELLEEWQHRARADVQRVLPDPRSHD